ncbi:serine O-acetyltransferase [Lichenifustis flavocetrariae]|uniref:Serine acetyltransferase n=1 Tax=Lichenifustis flavocetrariae TaxID=2949735 RepID=A0AA41Z941_9HYPH|nr:serine acetyltransferase [Lichenifustis flavocetrariae]MCW6511592.1 serine acetyltransferase [Lichenifustis flavocetrariae]
MNIIVEDFKQHRCDPFAWGFWALLIYRLGYARTRFKSPLIRKPWGAIHKLAAKWAELAFGISIGINVKIGRRFTIEHFGCIIIHNDVVIGDDVIIRQGVTLGNRRLDAPLDAPVIGSRVNIGAGAKILGFVKIGDDVNIGANAVVLADVPDQCNAIGVPAKSVAKSPSRSMTVTTQA